ncbi:protein of unknown function [Methylococcus capsulatus]|uniref:Uncharacterized protein n=1 Tax=Methylococcus capsulatus TaxID=414 RepID=A0AA35UCF1_METCP|nr:protein of unknown function [Methylococcus capsulatus]
MRTNPDLILKNWILRKALTIARNPVAAS